VAEPAEDPAPVTSSTATRGRQSHDELGARLRAERQRKAISMRELARRLDISASALSQIETGASRPSVATLYAIVSELGVSLDGVFRPEPSDEAELAVPEAGLTGLVQRAGARKTLELESGVEWQRLTAAPDSQVDFLFVVYEVGGASSTGQTLVRHSGREFGLVLKGSLRVTVGFEECVLGPGDSISFDSTTPHRLANDGDEPVEAVWFALGRAESDQRAQPLRAATRG
jgi:transcriptional regulator with XRE-family HTH domain